MSWAGSNMRSALAKAHDPAPRLPRNPPRPRAEFLARRALCQFGWTMPDGEIVTASDWLLAHRDRIRVRRGRVETRDGKVLRGRWLVRFVEFLGNAT